MNTPHRNVRKDGGGDWPLRELRLPPQEGGNELGEAVLVDLRPPSLAPQSFEEGGGTAAEPASELDDDEPSRRHPFLRRAGADEIVHGVEGVGVREKVYPQPQAAR